MCLLLSKREKQKKTIIWFCGKMEILVAITTKVLKFRKHFCQEQDQDINLKTNTKTLFLSWRRQDLIFVREAPLDQSVGLEDDNITGLDLKAMKNGCTFQASTLSVC